MTAVSASTTAALSTTITMPDRQLLVAFGSGRVDCSNGRSGRLLGSASGPLEHLGHCWASDLAPDHLEHVRVQRLAVGRRAGLQDPSLLIGHASDLQ